MLNERQGECGKWSYPGTFPLNGGTSHKFALKQCVSRGRQLNLITTFFKYLGSVQHSRMLLFDSLMRLPVLNKQFSFPCVIWKTILKDNSQ